MSRLTLLAASFMLVVGSAQARELKPFENYSIHFGDVSGSVYVDDSSAESRIVATLAGGQDAVPMRFVTSLSPGQKAIVSVPRALGEAAMEVTFTREGHQVFVQENAIVGSIQ